MGTNVSCAFSNTNCEANLTTTQVPILDSNNAYDHGAKIAAGWRHLCWITSSDGSVYCRGDARFADLGDGTAGGSFVVKQPSKVLGLTTSAADVSANRFYSCALQIDGQVRCWGGSGQWLIGLDSKPILANQDNIVTQATPVNWGNP